MADDFYRRLDALAIQERNERLFRNRPENLHEYQGCRNDPSMVPAAPAESQGVERAQPVEQKEPTELGEIRRNEADSGGIRRPDNGGLPCQECLSASIRAYNEAACDKHRPPAPVEGVERVTDDAPARVQPMWKIIRVDNAKLGCVLCKAAKAILDTYGDGPGHCNEHLPAAQPAKHTDDRPADTIPDGVNDANSLECQQASGSTDTKSRVGNMAEAEARIEVLEAALRRSLKWIPSTSPTYRIVCAALPAPSGEKEKV